MQSLKDAYNFAKTLPNAKEKSELLNLLVSAREEALDLQDENRELKKQIESHDRFEERMKSYRSKQVKNCTVYQHTDGSHNVCPHCVETRREIHPLHGNAVKCCVCGSYFPWDDSD